MLERAREGLYSTFEVQRGLPIQMLVRHFDQVERIWRIKPELRRNITFRPANLLDDFSALGTFDIVLCRNVLIYFDQPTKTRILQRHCRPHRARWRSVAGRRRIRLRHLRRLRRRCPACKGVYGHRQAQSKPAKPDLAAHSPFRSFLGDAS